MLKVKVNNMPEYAAENKYIVCTVCNNELWFWGGYDDFEIALKAAREVFGVIVTNEVENGN